MPRPRPLWTGAISFGLVNVPVRMFAAVRESAAALDPNLVTVPYLSTGATDSARMRAWGMQAFGLLPFPLNPDVEERLHGNDERVPLASLEFGTKLMYGAVSRVAR